MKDVLEVLQTIDTKLDDCRFYLTTMNHDEKTDELFNKLNEASKEVKQLINTMD